ncbi:MAG: DUF5908 family protein [Paraburkholderia sp.]
MIEIRELVIRVNVTEQSGDAEPARIEERLASLKADLLEACEERIQAALQRGVER